MNDPEQNELTAVFSAYGHAVYSAQILENGIRGLLAIVDHERKKAGKPALKLRLDDADANKTLGTLFEDLMTVEFVTEAEKVLIWRAVHDRNVLVHSYWDEKHILAMLNLEGRDWLIKNLSVRTHRCTKADKITTSFIDTHLREYGTSTDTLLAPLFDHWENDNEPPDEILR
jgi:hypothetical protein